MIKVKEFGDKDVVTSHKAVRSINTNKRDRFDIIDTIVGNKAQYPGLNGIVCIPQTKRKKHVTEEFILKLT